VGSFLVARLCQVSSAPLANLVAKIPNNPLTPFFGQGHEIAQAHPPEQIALMNKSAELLLSQFHTHKFFPQLFSDLIVMADTVFSSPLSEITKGKADKALHTKQIVKTEVLNDVDKLCCDVFGYLARVLSRAGDCPDVDFNQIQLDSVTIIFKYVEHFYPNAVRASAGTIVSSLSASAKHAQMICEMFWRQFGACKKDATSETSRRGSTESSTSGCRSRRPSSRRRRSIFSGTSSRAQRKWSAASFA
jgi:hypothetical protein